MVDLKISLPDSFFEAEERCEHYIGGDMKKLWAVELDLWQEFDRVCRENDITYYACGGTLLGAARHRGFIPWDDDIDLMMMRDEYDKLDAIAQEVFKEPYFWQTEYTDPGSLHEHAQLRRSDTTAILKWEYPARCSFNQGIFIDIFPLDSVPDDETEREEQFARVAAVKRKLRKLSKQTDRYYPAGTGIKKIVKSAAHAALSHMPEKLYGTHKLYVQMEHEATKYNDREDTERILSIAFAADTGDVIKQMKFRSDFTDVIYMPFEGFEMPVPAGYDHLLCYSFRDWHKLIKAETTHGGLIIDTDRPYTEYLDKML